MGNAPARIRTWHVPDLGCVELTHVPAQVFGSYSVRGNGVELAEGSSNTMDVVELELALPGGREAMLQIHPQGLAGFSYTLWVGGEEVMEANRVAATDSSSSEAWEIAVPSSGSGGGGGGGSRFAKGAGGSGDTAGVVPVETGSATSFDVVVTERAGARANPMGEFVGSGAAAAAAAAADGGDGGGGGSREVVGGGGAAAATARVARRARRFRDFAALDAAVRGSLEPDSHLLSSLPLLPPKRLKLLTDHGSLAFVEQRRAELEVYLRRLWAVPRLTRSRALQEFLGLQEFLAEGAEEPPYGGADKMHLTHMRKY